MTLTYCIDDSPLWIDLIKDVFDENDIRDYRLFTSPNDFIRAMRPDVYVAVIDHTLPRVTGLDMVRAVKNTNKHCQCIIVSATDDLGVIIDYCNEGIFKYVKKDSDAIFRIVNFVKEALTLAADRQKIDAVLRQYSGDNSSI